MDTIYKLIYSTLAVHWRSYLMYRGTNLLREIIKDIWHLVFSVSKFFKYINL